MTICHTHRSVQSWFEEHEDALQHLASTIAQLKYHQATVVSLREQSEKQLEEELYSIPQETLQNLHKSIPRRIQAVLQANGGPSLY